MTIPNLCTDILPRFLSQRVVPLSIVDHGLARAAISMNGRWLVGLSVLLFFFPNVATPADLGPQAIVMPPPMTDGLKRDSEYFAVRFSFPAWYSNKK